MRKFIVLFIALAISGCASLGDSFKSAGQIIAANAPEVNAQIGAQISESLNATERAQVCTNLVAFSGPFCAAPQPPH